MKTTKAIVFLLGIAISLQSSAVVVDPATHIRLLNGLNLLSCESRTGGDNIEDTPPYQPLIIQIDDDSVIAQLLEYGVIIYNQRDDLLLTSVPKQHLQEVLSLDGIINVAASGDMSSSLDIARPFGKVNAVQTLSSPFTGKGVVMGFSDIGFDPHHIAFKNKVVGLHNYDTEYGIVESAITPSEIEAWTTDDPSNFHATHVGNIMVGDYHGNDYYGVATGAELVATTSRLHDVGILAGVEDIIKYAKSVDKPVVINLSLANFLGAHDGTSLLCQYLSKCAKEAVICISAGNTGHLNTFATQDLSIEDAQVLVQSRRHAGGFKTEGYTDIWGDTDEEFEFCICIYDENERQVVYSTPWIASETLVHITDQTDEAWAEYMSGDIIAMGGVSPLNNRYNIFVEYDTYAPEKSCRGDWARYWTMLCMRERPESVRPVRVNIFADATYSYLSRVAGNQTVVGSQGSINDMCTAEGVVAVGMATSRNTAPNLMGEPLTWNLKVGEITPYSSYSDTPGIELLPHISGPGSYLISAISSYYLDTYPETEVSAKSEVDGDDYYWYAAGGTSMSAPYVAGVFAMWLEADPTLSSKQLIDIAQVTAQRDYSDIDNPRWGAGCIDALAGLEIILNSNGVSSAEMQVSVTVDSDRRLIVHGVDMSTVCLYGVDGRSVNPDIPLAQGIYIFMAPGVKPFKFMVH